MSKSKSPSINHSGIASDVIFGERVSVISPVNLYGCSIGDDCFVGPFVEIQRGAKIGRRTRIQSHSFICDKVTIGNDCFVGHGVRFINDRFSKLNRPAYVEKEIWENTNIMDKVYIGSGAIILPVEICEGSIIGAGSVVTKNIRTPGIYVGNPAKLLRGIDTREDQ